ncbi:MFS transporter [Streptomyces sp. HUAS MG47]|uniref:MFS transporter n=1 Tax=Streptomyces solicamelliae TaxID=3231716 RepID=UPI0038780234
MSSRPQPLRSLVALFTAGYTAPYLLPTVVGRLATGLGLTPTQAGLAGSALLLASACAGFALAGRVDRIGPRTAARAGLLAMICGYGTAAATGLVPLVLAGAVLGGFGSGTVTAVAASGIAARHDPHRASALGLLSVSATAGALYLTLPRLGTGHGLAFAAIATVAAAAWPGTRSLSSATRRQEPESPGDTPRRRLPHLLPGTILTATLVLWSLAQNALWGVSGRIGVTQAGLSEVTVGAVFAAALGAGLAGVTAARALGERLGKALPIGAGTALIAACVAVSAGARDLPSFAAGEMAWNAMYPLVLSYVIALSATLDPGGRWTILAGAASSLGVACGPAVGTALSEALGYPAMGATLAALLLATAVPLTAVARRTALRAPAPQPLTELDLPHPKTHESQPAYTLAQPSTGGL